MNTKLSRRKFVQLSAISGTFLAIGCVPEASGDKIKNISLGDPHKLNQFIIIDTEGNVTLFNHRPEMGQGTFQSVPMILAEELGVNMDQVTIKASDADPNRYGSQMVVGSSSMRREFEKLRNMGATAREMLTQAAANQWQAETSSCIAANGYVSHTSGKKLSYGQLVAAASQLEAPESVTLKNPGDFNIIGQPIARQDIPLKTNGSAVYGFDISVPGMLYASIERSPVFLGEILSFNEQEVLASPGVVNVLKTQRDLFGQQISGVAVIGKTYWAALQGRRKLKIEWDHKGWDRYSSDSLMDKFRSEVGKPGDVFFEEGNVDSAFKQAEEVITSSYEMPYQAHACMEPMNTLISVENDKAEFWGSTQNPNGTRSQIAKMTGIDENQIKINYTFMGGGFGRRARVDFVEEATDLSKQLKAPVKVIWTREDDITQGPFRNCSYNRLRGVLDQKGNIVALEHKVVAQEIGNQTGDNMRARGQMAGGITTDYKIPNQRVSGVLQKLNVPISYWRAVYHSTNPFAHESFMDELAIKAGKDPLDFRLSMLQNHPRFKRVLEETAKRVNWYDKPKGIGRGLAMVERSGAHFAMVVDVVKESEKIRIKKITTIIDVGICVNPDTVEAQTEGSIVMGLSAVFNGLTLKEGRIVEQNFNTFPILRYNECPEIETHILDSISPPDGAGESGLPTVAPALANALYDLTKKRVRKIPFKLEEFS